MYKVKRIIQPRFRIDTNLINSRSNLPAMNILEQWDNDGVIFMGDISEVAQKEAMAGNDPVRTEKALQFIYNIPLRDSEDNKKISEIKEILFPNGIKNQNQMNDVLIVFDCINDHAILITNDGASKSQPGGILGHRAELKKKFGLTIMTDKEAVEFVRDKISERDKYARAQCERYGFDLPNWVGKD
jgi:hypothetical protein